MLFNSLEFMLFFPAVVLVYFVIPKKIRYIWLLVASYFFYMSWDAKYALLIAFSTIVTYFGGRFIASADVSDAPSAGRKKAILISCIAVNLAILILFKYANFAIDSFERLCRMLHVSVSGRHLDLLLPVGISFYTFQALGYLIDVYRGDVPAEKNLLKYALFVSFFPQLVAGPIERSRNLLPQLRNVENIKLWNARRVTSGAILIVWGLFLKMVIADRISVLVDTVFNDYRIFGSTELILAAIGFSLQIYCDFNSYSTIAVGTARVMGIDLMNNFNTPYFACSIRDFWSRWHISLTSWFRDYVYIPLGGNRKGKKRKYLNVMIVFLLSGLWHGANWTFVLWGGIHGACQVIGDQTRAVRDKLVSRCGIKKDCFSFKLAEGLVTFVIVASAWVFFRSDTIADAFRFFMRVFIRPTPWLLFNGGIFEMGLDRVEMNILFISLLIMLVVGILRYRTGKTIDALLMEQNLWFEWSVIIVLIYMIFVFGEYGTVFDAKQFIYFQF